MNMKAASVRTPPRLAIVVTHPIQHFVAFYRALAAEPDIEIKVFFGSRMGVTPYFDAEMQSQIAWKMDLLSGYPHRFLSLAETDRQTSFSQPNSRHLGHALAKFRPDAVLVYGYAQINALRALHWCRARKLPAMIISDSEPLSRRSGWKNAVKRLLIPPIMKRFSAALSVGDQNETYYRSYGVDPRRIFRSPFTIDEPVYREASRNRMTLRAATRKEWGIGDDVTVALFVGKLSPRKRPGDLLSAVEKLNGNQGRRQIHAVFAGNGDLLDELRDAARKRSIPAHFLGFVNVDLLPSIYAAADILVHPAEADPHPLVCSEAACIGLPMILSDQVGAVGPTDIARADENALTYPCRDIEALAAILGDVADSPAGRAAMGTRSLEIFDELDTRRSVAGVKSALQAILGR
jgi:glycosyltransferase involved in cell wall biosynthesis